MAKYVVRLFKSLLTTFKLGKFLEEIQTLRVLNKFELDPPHHQFIVVKSGETLGRSIFFLFRTWIILCNSFLQSGRLNSLLHIFSHAGYDHAPS